MKTFLPVGKRRAWDLVATVEGLASWFPTACIGTVAVGEFLAFVWEDGSVDRFRVRRLGERHSSIAFDLSQGAEMRVYLHGRLTTLTLEVDYGRDPQGRNHQLRDLPRWAFRLANLKSVAVNGGDLRSESATPRRSWKVGFIDG